MSEPAIGPNPSGLCMCGCGQETRLAPYNIKRLGWVKGQPIRFIRGHHPKGPLHPRWKGSYFSRQHGRWIVVMPDGRRIFRARAVMEAHLGRKLLPKEIVHHINGDPTDDRIENLKLIYGHQGYHTSIVHYGYTEERLLELLRQHALRIGMMPTRTTVDRDPEMPNGKTYVNRFGSFKNALIKAGLLQERYAYRWKAYTKEELITQLRALAAKLGRIPVIADLHRDGPMPHESTYKKYFGTWRNALREAGLL